MKNRRFSINYQRTLHLPAAIILLTVLLGTAQAATHAAPTISSHSVSNKPLELDGGNGVHQFSRGRAGIGRLKNK